MQQTDSGDLLQFQEEATTFNLSAVLTQNKLSITLQDFTQWVLYSKDYTEQNIGGQIHRKAQLKDLFYTLVCTNHNESKKQHNSSELRGLATIREYTFGEIIKKGNRICYKVQRGGKLTIYTPGVDPITEQRIYNESKLALQKSRSMGQMQIMSEKLLTQKRQHSKKFQSQLQEIKQQKKQLQRSLQLLQQQHNNTKLQLKQTKQKLASIKQQQMKTNQILKKNNQELSKKNQQVNRRMTQLTQQNVKLRQQLLGQNKKNRDEVNKNKQESGRQIQKIRQQMVRNKTDGTNQVNKAKQDLNRQIQANKNALTPITQKVDTNANQLHAMQTKYQKLCNELNARLMMCGSAALPYYNKFRISGNQIEYIGEGNTWTQFIFNQRILPNTTFVFKMKIVKMSSKNIMIGVIDFVRQRQQRTSYSSNNAGCYYSSGGTKYGCGNASEGGGFNQGQIIEVTVNMVAKNIKWSVGNTQRGLGVFEPLGDNTRIIMPYIEFYATNDMVQWLHD